MEQSTLEKVKAITYRPSDRLSLMRALSVGEQSTIFVHLSPHVQQNILAKLKIEEIVDILDHMDLRMAENVLARIKDIKRRTKIISRLKSEVKDKIEYFLRFHPKATISLIHFNYLYLPVSATIGEAAEAIEEHYKDTGRFPEVLVHENGELKGEVSISSLVRERNSFVLSKFMRPVSTVTYQAEISEIVDLLSVSQRQKIVVLDHDQSVLGIIYADDALSLFSNMPTESLYDFTGVNESERPFDDATKKFKRRSRWLILNLVTAFLAGFVIFVFEDTIDRLAILAVYIPIVVGMGGNAASQTFAVMLRGITLGSISYKNGMPAIWNEVKAGFLNGLMIGLIVAVISVLVNGNPWLGLVVGLAMVFVHLVAGFFGAFVPLLLKHLGKDPASTSTIFITTATDVLGILILLALGSLLLL